MAFAKRSPSRVELPRMAGDSPGSCPRTLSTSSLSTGSRGRLPTVPTSLGDRNFVITGNPESANLEVVREEFGARGWVERESEDFHLKWGPKSKVDWKGLAPPQMVNHFECDAELTSKSGLAENLQASSCPADSRTFYPLCFHLDKASAAYDFAQEFKFSKACCVLREWLTHQAETAPESFHESVVRAALAVASRRLDNIDSQLCADTDEAQQVDFVVKRREWELLAGVDLDKPACEDAHDSLRRKQTNPKNLDTDRKPIPVVEQVKEKARLRRKRSQRSKEVLPEMKDDHKPSEEEKSQEEKEDKEEDVPESSQDDKSASVTEKEEEPRDRLSGVFLLEAVTHVVNALKADPQFSLNKRNIWIMKPSNSLRGHGIVVENDLDRILRHSRHKSCTYVCQKYIENPLLINGARKHDIRQWALVTSLNPLTVYFFSECYVRVAANEYSLDDFGDRFKHLTHTVIMKNHPNFNPDDEDWRCQWTQERYRKLLFEKAGRDVWTDQIRPAMQKIVISSLLSVEESLSRPDNHSCSFQLFGYDFMVDEDYNVWLLEVNDIPMLHASGPVTSRLCDPCLRDALSIVLDGPDRPKGDSPLRFELLYRGPEIPKLLPNLQGLDLTLDGQRIQVPKRSKEVKEGTHSLLRLSARRDQELQDLVDKRRLQEGKEQKEKERQLRMRRSLAKKLLGDKSTSSLKDVKDVACA
mmetsp:Transcript_20180/g.47745  ORF Transcript_20180/g.47745 Transcript_20180/m.47745 type:complete len:699 (+) Transcript_20180:49-2145(+)|eukprot:CAMPEP_0181430214 /NCGR_PEP_ID=MMETSP1110-20121109/17604_1 /TAXON_ID=174948 /ORGANISM="Symbiodinium sp., Strain CCMP421" /LENGTH=698 /DNA_ID=CAMNT_0023553515 /DNA_START=40 /DNA_END=2136 /DNA_ORIENTATION=-